MLGVVAASLSPDVVRLDDLPEREKLEEVARKRRNDAGTDGTDGRAVALTARTDPIPCAERWVREAPRPFAALHGAPPLSK
jgi:hypothetical protein